ncbi:DUF3052 domain-containing protein [Sphingomonas psychrotolerans]|uniref:DUF3052 domain-containing protein n=1 Tax=Sphingomonas psychrotolerans TaxID=1327635 RepID=A0ABU3N4D4_9SPHN|nr:DUF3052 family protein [Sphingomonas psychrotolerans]MDT8758642.1 DUF3052 domain-containing protein [Sphingomonas psychrotolerans]
MTAGYSGTPLADKLGLKRGMRCWFHNMPDSVRATIDPDRAEVEEQPTASDGLQCAHLFVTERHRLERELAALRPLMAQNGFIWVSWPKKAAKFETDVTEDVIRDVALPTGLVDIKVCAVDETWSGLKLVIRKGDREPKGNS